MAPVYLSDSWIPIIWVTSKKASLALVRLKSSLSITSLTWSLPTTVPIYCSQGIKSWSEIHTCYTEFKGIFLPWGKRRFWMFHHKVLHSIQSMRGDLERKWRYLLNLGSYEWHVIYYFLLWSGSQLTSRVGSWYKRSCVLRGLKVSTVGSCVQCGRKRICGNGCV